MTQVGITILLHVLGGAALAAQYSGVALTGRWNILHQAVHSHTLAWTVCNLKLVFHV